MDLYGLNEARSQGNAQTQDVSLFNEQIRVARDNINNTLDSEKIQAQGNMRNQEGRDLQDKLIYDFHDAISGGQIASSLTKYYKQLKGGSDAASDTAKKAKAAFGSATAQGDKVAQATTNEVNRTRAGEGVEQIRGGTTGTQSAPELSEEAQSSFLDESARAGGVDARATAPTPTAPAPTQDQLDRAEAARVQSDPNRPGATTSEPPPELGGTMPREDYGGAPTQTPGTELNNRPKTNEPVSANQNTPDIPDKPPTSTDELSSKILKTTEEAGKTASKVATGLRVAGDVGGIVSTYELFKNGLDKNKDGSYDVAGDVSQIASSVGTGLDILGAFIPGAGAGLEALGALAQGVGSVADTIDTHNKDEAATTDAQNDINNIETQRKAQLNALPQMKAQSAPVSTMASAGLVGTVAQHTASVTGGGTF